MSQYLISKPVLYPDAMFLIHNLAMMIVLEKLETKIETNRLKQR